MSVSPGRVASPPCIAAFAGLLALLLGAALPATGSAAGPDAAEDAFEAGRYLVTAGNCATCHTVRGGAFMAGGVAFATSFGTLYSTNITPDPETGIGAWNLADFRRAMRRGERPDGTHLYPAFPYTAYTRLSDADIDAIWVYLQRVPAVRATAPANTLRFPFNLRPALAAWKWLFLEPGPMSADASRTPQWNRGAYLTEALAHCSACHTQRNRFGAERDSAHLGGGEYLDRVPGGAVRPWYAPDLSGAAGGLGAWTLTDLEAYLATGRNTFLEVFGPMNDVVLNSTRYLRRDDLRAMAVYLKSLPVLEAPTGAAATAAQLGRGRTIYNLHCGTCHLPDGSGDPEMGPRLNRGSLVVQSANPASLINVVLHGPRTGGVAGLSGWNKPMPAFGDRLDDEEVAAVASFLRSGWDNRAGAVTPDDVARQR